jgi:hypothetical protein
MLQQSFQRTVNILTLLNRQSGGDIITIYRPSQVSQYDRVQTLRFYGFLTSLRARIEIKSLPESRPPASEITDSTLDRTIALQTYEWGAPRIHLELLMKTSRQTWLPIAAISCRNVKPYMLMDLMPYLTNNLSFDMANDAHLGVRIVSAGYGLLTIIDRITIVGCVREEITTIPTENEEVTLSQSHKFEVTNESQLIFEATPNRKLLVITNKSFDVDVTLSFGGVTVPEFGITLMRGGGSYEINKTNLYKGAISAITNQESTAILTGIEDI